MQIDNPSGSIILVTGATGTQGGAVIRHLLKNGHKVRAITRKPEAPSTLTPLLAKYPENLEIVRGDYNDLDSLKAALTGVTGVFSVQNYDFEDESGEKRQADTLINLAKHAGVQTFVHSSVNRAGDHEDFPRWNEGYWTKSYWIPKAEIEQLVKEAGFENYTILKPVYLMDNFIPPKTELMFPDLHKGEISDVFKPETKLHLISADDLGAFACAAFENPTVFNKKVIDLASEVSTFQEIVDILGEALNTKIKLNVLMPEDAVKNGQFPLLTRLNEWKNDVGYIVDIEALKEYRIPLTSFRDWAKQNITKP